MRLLHVDGIGVLPDALSPALAQQEGIPGQHALVQHRLADGSVQHIDQVVAAVNLRLFARRNPAA